MCALSFFIVVKPLLHTEHIWLLGFSCFLLTTCFLGVSCFILELLEALVSVSLVLLLGISRFCAGTVYSETQSRLSYTFLKQTN